MLYHLLYPLHTIFIGFNVFRYITFRAIGAAVTGFLLVILFGPLFIRTMKRFQIGQVIRDDGPETHLKKEGVPTMGGMMMLLAIGCSTLLWGRLDNPLVWLISFVLLFYGMIGGIDDYRKISRKNSKGLSARGKLILQVIGASVVGLFVYLHPDFSSNLSIPFFKNVRPDLGWLYIGFAILVIVGSSNAVNLTDGLDGLATVPSMFSILTLSVFVYISGHAGLSSYLLLPKISAVGEVAIIGSALVGALMGFLWYNCHPAEIFMGDSGSLSLGAFIGYMAIVSKNEILLILIGFVFVLETVSVILQVGSYRARKKRVFLMAPIHHHFEIKGWAENKIIVRFWIIALITNLIALITLKIR